MMLTRRLQLRNVTGRHEFLALVDEPGRFFLAAQQFNHVAECAGAGCVPHHQSIVRRFGHGHVFRGEAGAYTGGKIGGDAVDRPVVNIAALGDAQAALTGSAYRQRFAVAAVCANNTGAALNRPPRLMP